MEFQLNQTRTIEEEIVITTQEIEKNNSKLKPASRHDNTHDIR